MASYSLLEYFSDTNLGDKFGESLGGSQATPSFWEVPGLPLKFPKLPRKFFGDFPGSFLTVALYSKFPRLPRKFPRLPRKFPGLPRKFPGLPRRSALFLGSLTPSPDSQKLSLIQIKEKLGDPTFWPGPSAEMCRGFLVYRFWRILPGIFLEDFSGHFFPQSTKARLLI